MKTITTAEHSRLLLCDGSVDEVLGLVHIKDMLAQLATGKALAPRACVKEALPVHEGATILRLLDMFRQSGSNVALVVDEYGSVQGIATPRDIFSAIAGEFAEDAADEPGIVRRSDGSWTVDGTLRVADLERALSASDLTDEDYSTVAGLVLHRMGRLPRIGESVEFNGYRFEVADTDGRRIDRVIIEHMKDEDQQRIAQAR
jgi:putative hemolysin